MATVVLLVALALVIGWGPRGHDACLPGEPCKPAGPDADEPRPPTLDDPAGALQPTTVGREQR